MATKGRVESELRGYYRAVTDFLRVFDEALTAFLQKEEPSFIDFAALLDLARFDNELEAIGRRFSGAGRRSAEIAFA